MEISKEKILKTNKYNKVMCIYMIKNSYTGAAYIGSTINLQERLRRHIGDLEHNKHYNSRLQNSWNVSEGNFTFHIVEIVDNKDMLPDLESMYINNYNNSVYNHSNPLEENMVMKSRGMIINKKVKTFGKKPTARKKHVNSNNKPIIDLKKVSKEKKEIVKQQLESNFKEIFDLIYDNIHNKNMTLEYEKLYNLIFNNLTDDIKNQDIEKELDKYLKYHLRRSLGLSVSSFNGEILLERLKEYKIIHDGRFYVVSRKLMKYFYGKDLFTNE